MRLHCRSRRFDQPGPRAWLVAGVSGWRVAISLPLLYPRRALPAPRLLRAGRSGCGPAVARAAGGLRCDDLAGRGTDPSPPSEDFGSARRRLGLRRFGWGFGIGAVLAALAMVIAVAAGRATWQEDGERCRAGWCRCSRPAPCCSPPRSRRSCSGAFRSWPSRAPSDGFRRLSGSRCSSGWGISRIRESPGLPSPTSRLQESSSASPSSLLAGYGPRPGRTWDGTSRWPASRPRSADCRFPCPGWIISPRDRCGSPAAPLDEGGLIGALCLLAGAVVAARRTTKEVVA